MSYWTVEDSEKFRSSVKFAEVHVCFSSVSSTELKNPPEAKLMDCKSSKTFLKGPRTDSIYILKYKPDDLKCSFGHFEKFKFSRLNQIYLGYFMFSLA